MDDKIVLYKLIEYIKCKNSHGKNDLLNFITEQQIIQVKKYEDEHNLYNESRRLEIEKMKIETELCK